MYINISYKFHRIPDRQSHFITKVHDLLGQPSYSFNRLVGARCLSLAGPAVAQLEASLYLTICES